MHAYNGFVLNLTCDYRARDKNGWDLGMFCLYFTVQGIGSSGDCCARDKDVRSHGYAVQQIGLNARGTRIIYNLLLVVVYSMVYRGGNLQL